MTSVSVTVLRREPELKMQVSGELDLATEPTIVTAVVQAMADNTDLSVVDLDVSEVEFIDSCGVRALLHCRDVAATSGRRLKVTDVGGPVTRLLELLGIDDCLPLTH